MSPSLLVAWYRELPELGRDDDPDLWGARRQQAMHTFGLRVQARYAEGTLQRLLNSESTITRRAAVVALGAVGGMGSNPALARMLHDPDEAVTRRAAESLWAVWFRGSVPAHAKALARAIALSDTARALAALDALLREAPEFAEAYNQRAILFFHNGAYARSIRDCEAALRLNPFHFGAQAGIGQCFLKLRKPRSALRALRLALEINPTMSGLANTIRALEDGLGEGESHSDYLEG